MSAFEELGVMPELIKAIDELDWLLPTPVQQEAIPLILGGGDVLAAAETGSGKTGAFALPTLQIAAEAVRGRALRAANTGADASAAASAATPQGFALSEADRSPGLALSSDRRVCQARMQNEWAGARSSIGIAAGCYYFQVQIRDEGLCRIGWSTVAAQLELGTDRGGWGLGGTGTKSHNKQFDKWGQAFGKDDVIGTYFDADAGVIGYTKNGGDLGVAFTIPTSMRGHTLYPAVCMRNAELEVDFAAQPPDVPSLPGKIAPCASAPVKDTRSPMQDLSTEQDGAAPLVLVLEPSKELAHQTYQVMQQFSKIIRYIPAPGVRCAVLYGGVPQQEQVKMLRNGVDVVVATPGRMTALLDAGALSLANVRFFILDEADQLVGAGGSLKEVMTAWNAVPKAGRRVQTLLFSATLHDPLVRSTAERLTRFPTWVDLKGCDYVPDTIEHAMVLVDPRTDLAWRTATPRLRTDGVHARDAIALGSLDPATTDPLTLSEAIKLLRPHVLKRVIDNAKVDQAMIFVRTKLECDNLAVWLSEAGAGVGIACEYSSRVLHGGRSVGERRDALQAFKQGDVRFLIVTDVAARGIDIAGLPYVINYSVPDEPESYIHRVGRVGRADCLGLAVSLVGAVAEKVWYHRACGGSTSCHNTKPLEQGGCALWWNERDHLTMIQDRIGQEVPQLGAVRGEQKYGVASTSTGADVTKVHSHVAQLLPAVQRLNELEQHAQLSYLSLKLQQSS